VDRCLAEAAAFNLSPADILATLTEFTARSIALSYEEFLPRLPDEVLLCGGGSRNPYLVSRLQRHLPDVQVNTTAAVGVPPDLKEAVAFAVLGYWRYHQFPGNLPSVTGARAWVPLGDLHNPVEFEP
jgi:anhydro-N-acetylmuramic acid kinase